MRVTARVSLVIMRELHIQFPENVLSKSALVFPLILISPSLPVCGSHFCQLDFGFLLFNI